jgi:hypothetical protein
MPGVHYESLLTHERNPFRDSLRSSQQMVSRDRNCYMVNACISRTTPSMSFKIAGGLTSAVGVMSEKHDERIDRDIKQYGDTPTWAGAGEIVDTKCTTINHLLEEIGVNHIDYFSLDVEGAEMLVLESIDFSRLTVDVFTIEIQEHRGEIKKFMEGVGFTRLEDPKYKLSLDDIYVQNHN